VFTWLVTGGAGFLGANLVLALRRARRARVVNLDLLTYAGDRERLAELEGDEDHVFVHGDVADRALVRDLLARHQPTAVLHLAAETHVDRSIDGPETFLRTNVEGTLALLESVRAWWERRPASERDAFRFLHASTDEVFGALGPAGRFDESSPHRPRSPYAASKAAADHLVGAWHRTYGLPTLITHGTNTYGPWQLPEKLVPLMTARALCGEPLPVYGDGGQVRDWIHVEDHGAALVRAVEAGIPGESYLVGAACERTNLEVVHALCAALDARRPEGAPHARGLTHVPDRPGHDRRYALDAARTREALGWAPRRGFDVGLCETVDWMLAHRAWLERTSDRGGARRRLGLGSRT
jgi:dTDP-glucose 4,6-dehydratase